MDERDLYRIFQKKIKQADSACFCYKIPDGPGGGKRPFDMFLLIHTVAFAIEFKIKGNKTTPYQKKMLHLFGRGGGGGVPLVFTEGEQTMNEFIDMIMTIVKNYRGLGI